MCDRLQPSRWRSCPRCRTHSAQLPICLLDNRLRFGHSAIVRDGRRPYSLLLFATVVQLLTTVALWIVEVSVHGGQDLLLGVAIAPPAPLLVFAGLTIWQARSGRTQTTFSPAPLASSMLVMCLWIVGVAALGFWTFLLGIVVVPIALALLVVSWVQPTEERLALTVVLAIAVFPLLAWFLGRADEYLSEALISGAALACVATALVVVRQRSRRMALSRTA